MTLIVSSFTDLPSAPTTSSTFQFGPSRTSFSV